MISACYSFYVQYAILGGQGWTVRRWRKKTLAKLRCQYLLKFSVAAFIKLKHFNPLREVILSKKKSNKELSLIEGKYTFTTIKINIKSLTYELLLSELMYIDIFYECLFLSVSRGVPQGSLLSPPIFLISIGLLPMGQIICQHGLNFHSYADDIQMFLNKPHSRSEKMDGF